jgi:hypothetical protein
VAMRRPGNLVTLCDGHEVFLAASGRIRMATDRTGRNLYLGAMPRRDDGDGFAAAGAAWAVGER